MTLGVVLLYGPRRGVFLMSEVPLYPGHLRGPFDSRWERSPQTVTSKFSTGASKCLHQARLRTVACSENPQLISRGERGPIPLGGVEFQASESAEHFSGTVCLDSGRAGSSSMNTNEC